MQRVRILGEDLVARIAAGEIVERPASVVKELVENSLDAGSRTVVIEVRGGGRRLIRVTDDGSGMARDDAMLSIEFHATSKLQSTADLATIATMGFRGEALPSIASVSRLTLTTKTPDDVSATRITIHGGRLRNVEEAGAPAGTQVSVQDLFGNTPARAKFMKKHETELGHVLDTVQRLAAANPTTGFELTSDGSTLLHLYPTDSLEERLKGIWKGKELYPLGASWRSVEVSGYLSGPEDSRSSTQRLYFSVNRRAVRDRFVTRMVLDTFGRLLERGRYPQGILRIDLPAEEVDVNVHPAKQEVKFRDPRAVGDLVRSAVREMIDRAPWVRGYGGAAAVPAVAMGGEPVGVDAVPPGQIGDRGGARALDYRPGHMASEPGYTGHQTQHAQGSEVAPEHIGAPGGGHAPLFPEQGFYSSMRPVGQIGGLYIVCESTRGAVLIDQHAAHERINYERIKGAFENAGIPRQSLLIPHVLELSASEASFAEEHIGLLSGLGIEIEPFGGGSIRVRTVPALLTGVDPEGLVRDTLGELCELGSEKNIEMYMDHVIATMACHGSIRARDQLGTEEMNALLSALDTCAFPHACPHGRPVAREITFAELERMFKRT